MNLNLINIIPPRTKWRKQIENVLATIVPTTELERHVYAVLHNKSASPLMILKSVHIGGYLDSPHFNIKTEYSGQIHVYVGFMGNRIIYDGMTE